MVDIGRQFGQLIGGFWSWLAPYIEHGRRVVPWLRAVFPLVLVVEVGHCLSQSTLKNPEKQESRGHKDHSEGGR